MMKIIKGLNPIIFISITFLMLGLLSNPAFAENIIVNGASDSGSIHNDFNEAWDATIDNDDFESSPYCCARSSADGDLQDYGSYGFTLSGDSTVKKVEVGFDYFWESSGDDTLTVEVSADGGATWGQVHEVPRVESLDGNINEWIDVTDDADWDGTTLSDANFKVRIGHTVNGGAENVAVDYLPVRVTTGRSLKITRVCDDGDGCSAEWVEVYNPSNQTLTLDGLKESANGCRWGKGCGASGSVELAPDEFYLFGDTSSYNGVKMDQNLTISPTSDEAFIIYRSGTPADTVGWDATGSDDGQPFEGTPIDITNEIDASRDTNATGEPIDTQDNASDFTENNRDMTPKTGYPTGGSNSVPSVDLIFPDTGALVSGSNIPGTYVLTDPDNEPGTITVEISDDSGTNWDTTATLSGDVSSVSASSNGDTHSFNWDSLTDLGQVFDTQVKLRIRATDGTDTGGYDTSPAFTVDNKTPPDVTDLSSTAAINAENDGAALFWTYSSDDVKNFQVYRSVGTGDTSGADILAKVDPAPDTTSYLDTTATRGDSHFYYVTAVDTAGNESDSSNRTTAPHLDFTKNASFSSLRPGDTITYTIDYANTGYGPSSFTRTVDAIPANTVLGDSASVVNPPPNATIEYSLDDGSSWQTSSFPRNSVTQIRWTVTDSIDPQSPGSTRGTFKVKVNIQ